MNNTNRGCCNGPVYPEMCYNNVVKKCYVEEVPHVVNYNTHVINECVKKHITIPNYTTTEETVCVDQFEFRPYQVPYQQVPFMQPENQPMPIFENTNNGFPNMFNPYQF